MGWACQTKRSPKATRTSGCKCCRYMEWKLFILPREVSQTCWNNKYDTRSKKVCCEKSAEVIVPIYELVWEGPNLVWDREWMLPKGPFVVRCFYEAPRWNIGRNPKIGESDVSLWDNWKQSLTIFYLMVCWEPPWYGTVCRVVWEVHLWG